MIPSYPSTYHWSASMSVHRDDKYHRDPGHFVGKQVVMTEKLDGGVTHLTRNSVYARSSIAPTSAGWFDYVKSITLPKLYDIEPTILAIGEDCYGVHSIEYDSLPDSFFLFHILERHPDNIGSDQTEGDFFWGWDMVEMFAEMYNLRTVPVRFKGTFDSIDEITDWFMSEIKKPSEFGPDCEGFVMRITDGFRFQDFGLNMCKFVRPNHVQTSQHWTKTWKPARISSR